MRFIQLNLNHCQAIQDLLSLKYSRTKWTGPLIANSIKIYTVGYGLRVRGYGMQVGIGDRSEEYN